MELNETYYDEDEIEIDLVELFYVMKRKLDFLTLLMDSNGLFRWCY